MKKLNIVPIVVVNEYQTRILWRLSQNVSTYGANMVVAEFSFLLIHDTPMIKFLFAILLHCITKKL